MSQLFDFEALKDDVIEKKKIATFYVNFSFSCSREFQPVFPSFYVRIQLLFWAPAAHFLIYFNKIAIWKFLKIPALFYIL